MFTSLLENVLVIEPIALKARLVQVLVCLSEKMFVEVQIDRKGVVVCSGFFQSQLLR